MVLNNLKSIFIFFTCLTLSACSLFDIQQLDDKTKVVKIYDAFEHINQCQFINELIGSEGTWYSYLFVSNKDLTLGSINDLKNQANAMGANAIHIQYSLDFNTSVTFFAQAYDCAQ
ncbi:putative outer membrane lipoprotein [Moritella sp. PE36]|uniref:DUF4156 domain-containing protein n=1 Tax=Moritella sp. PE36 TaxID=58051 RepID=UPI0001568671|nr:DUF4156 domain-containing protein [Moritella sp. PE36]EDM67719.1 putative outer membrane lipoprotein [Moritella sp. PE36]